MARCDNSVFIIALERMWFKTIENWINDLIRAELFPAHKQMINNPFSAPVEDIMFKHHCVLDVVLSLNSAFPPISFILYKGYKNKMALILPVKKSKFNFQVNNQTWSLKNIIKRQKFDLTLWTMVTLKEELSISVLARWPDFSPLGRWLSHKAGLQN